MVTKSKPARRTQGMNWIRPAKRLAIYMRDGLACVWCGEDVENVILTLDHLTPYSKGGSNDQKNLVTCCHRCNSSRGNRSKKVFASVVAKYLGRPATAAKILAKIEVLRKGALNIAQAQELMDRRGGFKAACKTAA